ncbi:MAG: MFS transporter [Deltaproteobacteria bacterium]|nr:MFS transporter [Deltaproteobacteria bacterium]
MRVRKRGSKSWGNTTNLATQKDPVYQGWRIKIFVATWLGYAAFYFTRKAFSVAKIGLSADPSIGFDNDTLAFIDAAYLAAYMFGQFFWGPLGDRFGPRRIVIFGMLCSVLAAIFSGFSTTFFFFALFSVLQGLAQSTGWAPLTKNISTWFSFRERGRVMGWWCTNYAIGGLIASPFAGLMAGAYFFNDWRYAFFMPALVLLLVAVLFYIIQRDKPEDVGLLPIEDYQGEARRDVTPSAGPASQQGESWRIICEVLKNKTVWALALVYFFLKPTRYAILFWGPKYINEQFGSGVTESSFISAIFELGGPLGALLSGYVSDKLFKSKRMPVIIIPLAALAVVLFFFNHFALSGKMAVGILFFLIGLFVYGPDSLISGTAAIDFGTKRGAGTAAGFINGMGSLGAVLGGSLPGIVAMRWGWGGVFTSLAVSTLFAAILLIPFWKKVP